MTLLLAVLLAAAIALPHLLRLDRSAASAAMAIWLAALVLRALTALFSVVYLVVFLPRTDAFVALTHWCWHAVLPLIATHLGLNGHEIGDVATIAPAFFLLVSAASVWWALWRAARGVRALLAKRTLGPGPAGSVIVGGPDVLVAAAGVTRPRVIVSAGALTVLDDAELAASLDHEHGHIARRHSYILALGEVCRALGRFIPGSRRACAELTFHLERDADAYALARRHDPLALASAICKAAASGRTAQPALGLGGGRVTARLRLLTEEQPPPLRSLHARAISATAAGMVTLALALTVALPATALAGAQQLSHAKVVRHCPE